MHLELSERTGFEECEMFNVFLISVSLLDNDKI
jgi:hypothetical protein